METEISRLKRELFRALMDTHHDNLTDSDVDIMALLMRDDAIQRREYEPMDMS